MGHGFGLPHTDENFFNKDLGNCMDYTNNPKNNKQPAEPNFIFLAQLYGTVDGSPVPTDNSAGGASNSTTTATAQDANGSEGSNKSGSWKDIFRSFGNRRRRAIETNGSQLPPLVAAALENIDELIDSGSLFGPDSTNSDGWRRLHQSVHGELHELDLGEGFTLRIHLLR
jgi:hypothetical protein